VVVARTARAPLSCRCTAQMSTCIYDRSPRTIPLRLVMRGADRIVACSEAMARQTIQAFRMRAEVTSCTQRRRPRAFRGCFPARVPHGSRSCFACAARPQKGRRYATSCLCADPATCPTCHVLVGGGPLLEEHQALARTLQIEQRVVFTGTWRMRT
jgi:hypothetical protein